MEPCGCGTLDDGDDFLVNTSAVGFGATFQPIIDFQGYVFYRQCCHNATFMDAI